MEKIDFENMYFHGLCGNIITINSDEDVINTSLQRLESIINTGGLLSRNKLEQLNIKYSWKGVFNGNDYISVCVKNPPEKEFEGLNEGLESSYVSYVERDRISIIINNSIKNYCTFREDEHSFLPGERQVKDEIGLPYFIGIGVMFENEESQIEATNRVNELLNKYNIQLPIVDKNFKILESTEKISR